jgi:hypothetical protein
MALVSLTLWFQPIPQLSAQPSVGNIVGLGAVDCFQFLKDVKESPTSAQREYLAWSQGFMSGVLLGRPPGVDEGLNLNPSTFGLLKQLEFLREYCTQQPFQDFVEAVKELYKRLREERNH